ncbi:hypothetical protein K6025_01460 [Ehrlichia sp. JZT12]
MLFFSKISKNRIVISVGDHGAVMLNIVGDVIQDKYFIENIQDVPISQIISCITAYKRSPIYLVLNHSDQFYTEHSMPMCNRLIARSLMKMSLSNVMGDCDIGSAFLLSEPTVADKNWHYMLATSQLNDLSKKLLEVILDNSSNFCGILLLPIELSFLCSRLLKLQDKNNSEWTIFVAYTKTNHFRQIVLHKGKIVHVNNIIISSDELLSDIIAGKVYQEICDTILHLEKFGYTKGSVVDLYIITSSSIKTSLLSFHFKDMDSHILTPYELSKVLMLKQSVSIMSEFCDTVILYAITDNSPLKIFHTKSTNLFYKIFFVNTYVIPSLLCLITLMSLLNISYIFRINSNYDEKINLLIRQEELISRVEKINQDNRVRQVNEMYETIDVYKLLLAGDFFSFDLILRLRKVDFIGFNINYLSLDTTDQGIAIKLLLKFVQEKQFSDYYDKLKANIAKEFKDCKTEVIDSLPSISDDQKIIVVKLEK